MPLLQTVSQLDAATLQRELGRLVEAEIVYQRGVPPQATYTFKHALIQDAAYESLLKSTRQQYHQRIAQVLEAQFPETAEAQPEFLAHHYTEAGLIAQAVSYWHKASQRASDRSANMEAISHLTTGIALLQTCQRRLSIPSRSLTLYIALGAALVVTKGYAASEVEHAYTRARALCQQVGETRSACPGPVGLGRFYLGRLQLHTAREIGEQLAAPGATCRTTRALAAWPTMPSGRRGSTLARCRRPAAPGARHRTLTPDPAASDSVFRSGAEPGCALPGRGDECPLVTGVSGASPAPASTRPWRWRTSCRIPIVWRLRGLGRPACITFAGRCRRCRAGRGRRRARDRAGLSVCGGMEHSCVGGRWPCRARARRGWPRCTRG